MISLIYLLSDLHGDIKFPGLKKYVDIAEEEDLLIILGDVGLNFENTEQNHRFNEYFLSIKKNIAFIDGNHDNFEYLNSFPEEEWNGGVVGRITDNIVHLKRGNIYEIDGKSFFVFGGCKSSAKWKEMGLWYYGEEPEDDQLCLAYENLKKHNHKVDYILTHKYEKSDDKNDKLQQLTDFIDDNVQFAKWYAGHWHTDEKIDDRHIIIYNSPTPIE